MSRVNWQAKKRDAMQMMTGSTTTDTLLESECVLGRYVWDGASAGGTGTLNLPAASPALDCCELVVCNSTGGTDTGEQTLNVTAGSTGSGGGVGFGGAGTDDDVSALSVGEYGMYTVADGFWFAHSATAPA